MCMWGACRCMLGTLGAHNGGGHLCTYSCMYMLGAHNGGGSLIRC